MELIQVKTGRDLKPVKIKGSVVYEKTAIAKAVPMTYFKGPSRLVSAPSVGSTVSSRPKEAGSSKIRPLAMPKENDILDISKKGEDQIYEFKGQGADPNKISREIAAMLNTSQGGFVLYGIADDGTIQGTNVQRQKMDNQMHNSIRNTISPAPAIKIQSVMVMGHEIIVITVPPWNRRNVYQFEGRVLIRHGTNVFQAKPEECTKLYRGRYVV